MEDFRQAAKIAKMSLSSYGKNLIMTALGGSSPQHEELVNRMMVLEATIAELKHTSESQMQKLIHLTMAALASSAMLKDDGKGSDDEGNRKVLDHIASSIAASPSILKLHQKTLS